MITRFIGVKELRQNMSKITKRAQKKNERLIVLRKNEPIFELKPLSKGGVLKESFLRDVEVARKSARAGNVYSHNEVRKMLGL